MIGHEIQSDKIDFILHLLLVNFWIFFCAFITFADDFTFASAVLIFKYFAIALREIHPIKRLRILPQAFLRTEPFDCAFTDNHLPILPEFRVPFSSYILLLMRNTNGKVFTLPDHNGKRRKLYLLLGHKELYFPNKEAKSRFWSVSASPIAFKN